jgi:hypothetical protein
LIAGVWALFAALLASLFLYRRLEVLRSSGYSLGAKGFLWCGAASLLTVLPLIPLPKSMGDFLHEPLASAGGSVRPLHGYLLLGFCCLSLWGWILAGFLLHGVGHLTGL